MTRNPTIRCRDAVEAYLGREGGDTEALRVGVRKAWAGAYERAGRPIGHVAPEAGQTLIALWQEHLKREMKKTCERFTKPQMLLALREALPQRMGRLGWISLETEPGDETRSVMALRRIASYAALIYGRKPRNTYDFVELGTVGEGDKERFAKAFLSLLRLSEAYFWSWALNTEFGLGQEMDVSEDGFAVPPDEAREKYALRSSLDARKQRYFSPFARIGEFVVEAAGVPDPFDDAGGWRLGDQPALLTSAYALDLSGQAGHRLQAWPLDPLWDFMERLSPELVRGALGLSAEQFAGLLAGAGVLVRDVLSAHPQILHAAYSCSVVPVADTMIRGEELIDRAAAQMRRRGLDPSHHDLPQALPAFLGLASSSGKERAEEPKLRLSIGDTRYSYLLHEFGRVRLFDLFHADHWLHRPMDLLSSNMVGPEGTAKGNRVEDAVWEYMKGSHAIETVEELRNRKVRVGGKDLNDIDCPLRVGDTLILVEAKGKLLRYPAERVGRRDVLGRWSENVRFLTKIDETAEVLSARRDQPGYREGMKGIERILPVVCRPYPEWIGDTDPRFWLRAPAEKDPGVPRILTPQELKGFLERASASDLHNLPGGYPIEVGE